MTLAVVLLNWNGEKWLRKFLPNTLTCSVEAEVCVIDNGSTDNSIDYVRQFPEVTLITLEKNKGYADGYNEGLSHIKAELYCLLNTDVEVTPNWIPPLMTLFQSNSNIAIAQPHLLDYNRRTHFEYAGAAGGYLDALGYPYCRGRIFNHLEADNGQYDKPVEVAWASGACFFIRREIFESLGGFDDSFFAHQEEIDLCWRARNESYLIFATGASKVYHVGAGTLSHSPFKQYLNYRNSLFLLIKNLPSYLLFPRLLFRLLLDGVAGLIHLSKGEFQLTGSILTAHFHFYKRFYNYFKQRTNNNMKNYNHTYSIVIQYFIKKNKKFNQL